MMTANHLHELSKCRVLERPRPRPSSSQSVAILAVASTAFCVGFTLFVVLTQAR